ncbi:hypothetical protein ACFQJD_00675 [Haloplanus sp. GCM10025708]|uniref:hypothetical protein n=1 Tax=Haloplanus sp. GCM10025708 TaxID=3252679 RepID=UPI00361DA7D8
MACEEPGVDQRLQLVFDGRLALPGHILEFGERHQMGGMAQQLLNDEMARILGQQLEQPLLFRERPRIGRASVGFAHT